ncbi:trypsin-like peptidase domain-containing protein [Sphaerospermopsis aphanizomenoides BCCUSP55]|uniref:trypsin-like serine peptidase n=1 Tax=Sphaerospermopsis aphanizomenoides TaxID=459663 RepID=UPI0019077ECB|nr:serine protease [Sphaerospermopsis aphanizomenoides]MBK1989691.1 trypsin-like peptidase domain-containing protein [Sphaerospermopsis aphanizomenoides BCCUSP55]
MNEITQNLGLHSPSITLYAFHLRNSINQGEEPTVAEAPQLWEHLVDLGNKLHIGELQTLQQQLICYQDNHYFPQAEDSLGVEYSNLLRNQEQSLNFRLIPRTGGLKLQGLLCPFRLHDSYAIDLTLYSQDTFSIPQLSNLNYDNLLLPPQIQASLGQTLLLFGQPTELQEDYQYLADACVNQILSERNSTELIGTGYLLGNTIFEYESAHTDPTQKLHILVWLKCQDMNQNHMDKVAEILLYLLWCRHKIQYVYHQSRWCDRQTKKLYGKLPDYERRFHQITQTANQQWQLRQLQVELQQIGLEYARYLGELSDHKNTIAVNELNYRTKLQKLESLPETNLELWQQFLHYVGNKLQQQIQTDISFLERGRDRLQLLKVTVQESIATAPVENQSRFNGNSWEQPGVTNFSQNLHYHEHVAVTNDMPGIRLKQALLDCDQFKSHSRLFDFFDANESLKPWRDELPEVDNRAERAERVIAYLKYEYRRDTGENVLLILLHLLKRQIDPVKELHQTLSELIQELEPILAPKSNSKSNLVVLHNNPSLNDLRKAEANPKGEPMPYIAADEKLLNCARAVARVSVPKIVNGNMRKIPTGTGWLVTSELALTCWHVIEARDPKREPPISASDLQKQIANSVFTFDFTQAGVGIEYGLVQMEHDNLELDYAVVRLRDRQDSPLQYRRFLRLDVDIPFTLGTQLYVIQHPKGQPQQRSGGYYKSDLDSNRILHSAPTEEGTSGAPVLNVTNFQVVALHNGENETQKLREATKIKTILSDLQHNRPKLYDEIIAAQSQNQE